MILKEFLNNFHKIEDEILEDYISNWTTFSLKRKTILSLPNKTERYLYYVKSGIQKSYYLNNGKEHVMFFAYAPSFSGIVESFLTQKPSRYYLQTITDSTFLRISYSKHQELIYKHRDIETLFRKITEYFLQGIIERHHELLAYKAEKRFFNLLHRSPHLLNLIPQKDLASYLRIDPTNFSKLINKKKI